MAAKRHIVRGFLEVDVTVPRHISNIYSELGAKNRTQAISLGKKLNLFG
jgi:ATP/maltotriose-dependent transcriptional regulator MalT